MYEWYGPKKTTPKNVSYLLPLPPRRFTPHQGNTSYPNASPPSRHCACPKPKQAQGPLRSHNIPSHQKSITFPSISLRISFKIWTKFIKFFIQVIKPHNSSIDPTTHFWGDPISITLFFLLITKMKELFTTLFYI
jgi:hypothetical protein